jgi:hypothetical protein
MKVIAAGRLTQVAAKYQEHAPVATACCMSCRTCVTSNLIGLAAVPFVVTFEWLRHLRHRDTAKPSY